MMTSNLQINTINTGHLPTGEIYREFHVGDFVERTGAVVTSIGFTSADASNIATLMRSFGPIDTIAIALYPWMEKAWSVIIANDWSTLHQRSFDRRILFNWRAKQRWIVGCAHTVRKLEEVIHWAWTLPGHDTLLFVPTESVGIGALMAAFEDDKESAPANELKLLTSYSTVMSRGYEGRYLRVMTTREDIMQLWCTATPPNN